MQKKMEIAKRILFEFEKKYDPYLYKNDITKRPTWGSVRERLYNHIISKISNESNSLKGKKREKKLTFRTFKFLIKRIFDFNKKKVLLNKDVEVLFISNSYFRRGVNSENIFFDGIFEYLEKDVNYLVLEMPTLTKFDGNYFLSESREKVIPLDYYLPFILFYFFNKRKYFKEVQTQISKIFEVKQPSTISIGNKIYIEERELIDFIKPYWINESIKTIAWSQVFRRLYKKMNPKIVIDVASASRFAKTIYEKDTKFMEIQHGIIHPYHMGYIYPNLKSASESMANSRKLLVYGRYYKELLTQQSVFDEENLIEVGNPVYSNFSDFVPVGYSEFLGDLSIKEGKKILLFTSQYEKNIQEIIFNFIKKLTNIIDSEEYVILVRLHPREILEESIYVNLKNDPNIIFTTDNPSLQDLLNYSYVHLSISSTVLLEATLFDIPNIVINSQYAGYINKMLDNHVFEVKSPKEFVTLLDRMKKIDSFVDNKNINIRSRFFGNKQNTYSEIAELIKRELN